jgi:TonB family protein
VAVVVVVLALGGCDRRERSRNAGGSLREADLPATTSAPNVYRFASSEQSLADARKAVKEERWDQALAASSALLRQQPANVEAQSLNHQAALELPSQQHYNEVVRAAQAGEVGSAVKHYRQIAEASMYRVKARAPVEKLRDAYLDGQDTAVTALARAGRCDDGKRLARTAGDLFPEAHGRFDDVLASCRPAPAAAKPTTVADERPAPAPVATREEPRPPPPTAVVASVPATPPPAPAPAPAPVAPIPPPPPDKPQVVALTAIEGQMIAGEKEIHLPPSISQALRGRGVNQAILVVKLCIDAGGSVTQADVTKSCGFAEADQSVAAKVREWRFRPYLVKGQAVPVCAVKLFRYVIE